MVRIATENCKQGAKVGGQLKKAVRFADDQAMVADSDKELQEIMHSGFTSGHLGFWQLWI